MLTGYLCVIFEQRSIQILFPNFIWWFFAFLLRCKFFMHSGYKFSIRCILQASSVLGQIVTVLCKQVFSKGMQDHLHNDNSLRMGFLRSHKIILPPLVSVRLLFYHNSCGCDAEDFQGYCRAGENRTCIQNI